MRASPTWGLAVLVTTALVGCSTLLPPASPTLDETLLTLYSSDAAHTIVINLAQHYKTVQSGLLLETPATSHARLYSQLLEGSISHFVTLDLPNSQPTLWAAPLAQTGMALVVHRENPIESLTLDELRRIYLGNVTTWLEVDGLPIPIVLYSREEGADSRAEFDRLVMGNRRTSPNALVVSSSDAALASVRTDISAIAYLPFADITPDIKILKINNIPLSTASLQNNVYPLRSTVYIVGLDEPTGDLREFVAWIQSDEGQGNLEFAVPLSR